jgi:hypothetical protein
VPRPARSPVTAVHPPPSTDAGATFDAGACATLGQDCTSARCCSGLVRNDVSDSQVCDPKINGSPAAFFSSLAVRSRRSLVERAGAYAGRGRVKA